MSLSSLCNLHIINRHRATRCFHLYYRACVTWRARVCCVWHRCEWCWRRLACIIRVLPGTCVLVVCASSTREDKYHLGWLLLFHLTFARCVSRRSLVNSPFSGVLLMIFRCCRGAEESIKCQTPAHTQAFSQTQAMPPYAIPYYAMLCCCDCCLSDSRNQSNTHAPPSWAWFHRKTPRTCS